MARKRPSRGMRGEVFGRAGNVCEYCFSQLAWSPDPFTVEHIVPVVLGGETVLDNLAMACGGCNMNKHDHITGYDQATGQYAPLYHPRKDKWDDHFRWQDDFSHVVGITPTGRATVNRLLLNREGVVNLRRVLYAIGKHPPNQ